MPKALDQDLRDRVIDAVLIDGMSRRGAASRFGVSESSAIKWVRAAIQDDRRQPVGTGGHRPSVLTPVRDWILQHIKDHPDVTLEELCSELKYSHGVSAWPSMLHYFFKREGISFKKNRLRQRAGET